LIQDIDIEEAVCTAFPENFFCPQQEANETKREAKPSICVPNLCYTASLLVREKVYSMERRCVNVANQYPTTTLHRDSNSGTNVIGSTILTFFVYICHIIYF
jgi:hypothetical protein